MENLSADNQDAACCYRDQNCFLSWMIAASARTVTWTVTWAVEKKKKVDTVESHDFYFIEKYWCFQK